MRIFLVVLLLSYFFQTAAQDKGGYQTPPKDITDLVLARPIPFVSIDRKGEWMLLMERSPLPTVEELAQPELRIAGLRINPNNFSPSRTVHSANLQLKNIKTGQIYQVKDLPPNLRATSLQWNSSENKIAFTNLTNTDVSLWVIDVPNQTARKISNEPLNAVMGSAYLWADDNTILYKAVARSLNQQPLKPSAPNGPIIQESKDNAAASRTYQDLIRSGYDEALFEFYATSVIKRLSLADQKVLTIGVADIYSTWSLSPNKKFILARTIDKPFSYLFPWSGFPHTIKVIDAGTGNDIKVLAKNPSNEGQPIGFDDAVIFPRDFDWRDDEPATITYVQALDKGLGRSNAEYRDAFMISPVDGTPRELFKTKRRLQTVRWANSELALVYEGSFAQRKSRISKLNPSTGSLDSLYERSSNDNYANIGTPVTVRNEFGRDVVLVQKNGELLLDAAGASPKGDLPLLQTWNLKTGQRKILWQCEEGYFEYVVSVIDAEKMQFITRRESPTQNPNYYLRELQKKKPVFVAITDFKNPYSQLEGIIKQKISYKRADGVDLTADLYLPKGYDQKKDGLLPVLIWAYPREYKSVADAAQVRGSRYTFTTISGGSPLFYVTQGYAVMDNAEMPIVGSDGKEPNDNFIPQLYLNAHAAIQAVARMGVGDSTRVAVGGHSYGAFMTANLLAHTKLFKAGIARSGAYNRTLTPFGFQAEERTYWQAPEVYYNMSPFSHADKIKTPLLLIHGELDNNPGTFPIQTERLFNAIKGHGGTVRYIQLPYESHGYTGKENVLHMLWEQHQWLEKYVKNADKNRPSAERDKKSF